MLDSGGFDVPTELLKCFETIETNKVQTAQFSEKLINRVSAYALHIVGQ